MENNKLEISNLPTDINESDFREIFSRFGKIQSLLFDHSKATICYFDRIDAQNTAMDYYGPHIVLKVLYGGGKS